MLNEIFSYLPGCFIIHKIALLNRRIRLALTKLEPYGQARIITLKIGAEDFTTAFYKRPILEQSIFRGHYYENGVFRDSQDIRPKTGLVFRVIKKLLDFTNNLRIEINDCNF